MKIETIEVSGFISCLHTLRKPFKKECRSVLKYEYYNDGMSMEFKSFLIPNDKDIQLLQRLIKKGDEHAKALRLINVTADIKAPLYWWNEMVTYEVGVTKGCSESTMHTLKKEILTEYDFEGEVSVSIISYIQWLIDKNTDINIIKSTLPNGYLQARDINFSYQTLRRIYKQRKGHKLQCWETFLNWIESLPMSFLITE